VPAVLVGKDQVTSEVDKVTLLNIGARFVCLSVICPFSDKHFIASFMNSTTVL